MSGYNAPRKGDFTDEVRFLSVSTPVSPSVSLDSPPPIPWRIIVLATLVGLLILLIIILILWMVVFQQAGNLEKSHSEFIVIANSTNKEADHTVDDNVASANVVVNVDTDLMLYGISEPEMLEYNISQYPEGEELVYEEEFGPIVIHKYGLSNKGPSDVLQVDIVILWPLKTLGNDLLYLLEQPFTSGPVVCDTVPNLNPLNLELFNRGETYKRLKLHSSLSQTLESSFSSSSSRGEQSTSFHSSGGSSGSIGSGSSRQHHQFRDSSEHQGGGSSSGGGSSGGSSKGSHGSSSSSSSSGSSSGGNYSKSYSSSSSSQYSSSSGYKTTDSARQNQIQQRHERSADYPELDWDTESQSCGATDCAVIKCTAGPLAEGDDLYVYLRSRVQLQTLLMFPYKDLQISSRMVARVRRLPQRVNPDFLKVRSLSVSTPMSPSVSLDSPPPIL